ncbi:MAG: ribose transport system substrate-binding protein, partial [Microbacteriaceae bacterium]|nr:ribose transport system substrate-binding protein [Microbacteriaceae bacterium]
AQLVAAALAKDPDIVGIFATNLFAAEGTATGVRQAGAQGKLSIIGFDAGPAQVKQLEAGTVQALIAQEPATIGTDGVQQAIAALKGQSVKKTIQTGFTVITKDTLTTTGKNAVYKSAC